MNGSPLLIAAALVCVGCPKAPPPKSGATVSVDALPKDLPGLVAFADAALAIDTAESAENALMAIDRGLLVEPNNVALLVRGARACSFLAEIYPERDRRRYFADHGLDMAKALERLEPARVEGHYYHGTTLGFVAMTKTVGAVLVMHEIVRAAKRAIERNERFDHGGPLRLLGAVYAKAPPWPASVGDVDEAVKYLRRAVEVAPEHPLNHHYLGEALAADEQPAAAARSFEEVLKSPNNPEWDHRLAGWKRDAETALQKLSRHTPPPTN